MQSVVVLMLRLWSRALFGSQAEKAVSLHQPVLHSMPIVYIRLMCSASRKEKTHIRTKLEALFITGIALIGHGLLILGTDIFVSAAAQVSSFVARRSRCKTGPEHI